MKFYPIENGVITAEVDPIDANCDVWLLFSHDCADNAKLWKLCPQPCDAIVAAIGELCPSGPPADVRVTDFYGPFDGVIVASATDSPEGCEAMLLFVRDWLEGLHEAAVEHQEATKDETGKAGDRWEDSPPQHGLQEPNIRERPEDRPAAAKTFPDGVDGEAGQ